MYLANLHNFFLIFSKFCNTMCAFYTNHFVLPPDHRFPRRKCSPLCEWALAIYLAGAGPYAGDRLGCLALMMNW